MGTDLEGKQRPGRVLALNLSRWPVIEITNPPQFAQQDWNQLIEQIVHVLKRDVPFAMINDVRVGPPPSAQQRKDIAKMYRAHLPLVKKNWRGTALVTSSSVIKGAITALNWLIPPPHPAIVCSNYQEAERWAFLQLNLAVRLTSNSHRPEQLSSRGRIIPPPPSTLRR